MAKRLVFVQESTFMTTLYNAFDRPGQDIVVKVDVTANHKVREEWFRF